MSPRVSGVTYTYAHGDQRATFSPDRLHRYTLLRGPLDLMGAGMATWIMLNPSTADEYDDDPTIRRCISFSTRWGYRFLQVVNLFAFRATDPANMKAAEDPVGPDNDKFIVRAAGGYVGLVTEARHEPTAVICAWGKHGSFRNRATKVLAMLRANDIGLHCLGTNDDNSPRHPLYLPDDTQRVNYRGTAL